MRKSGLIRLSSCLAALFALAECAPQTSEPPTSGTGGSTATGYGGSTGPGGATGAGGAKGTGGTLTGAGGTPPGQGTGGNRGAGGTPGTGGTPGAGVGGMTAGGVGGTPGTGGAPIVDMGGVPLAKPGDQTPTSKQYLNLGDMRLINNRWGSDARNCTGTMQKVYVNLDRTIGWDFNRPTCGGARADPDFPEVEFGVAPFGNTSTLLTTPAFSSTALLPIQLKDLTSASVNIDTFATTFTNPSYYDTNFEF